MVEYNVIQIMDGLGWGGVSSFVYDLCVAERKTEVEVSLIGLVQNRENLSPIINKMLDQGIRVECLGAPSRFLTLMYILKLRRIIKRIRGNNKTICNLHLKLGVLMGTIATLGLKNIYRVETYHNSYHHYLLQNKVLSPFIHKYICVSEVARKEMYRRFRTSFDKVVTVQNGIDRNAVRTIAQPEKYEIDYSLTRLISVGRLSWEKNFLVPIKAFSDICCENIQYTIVGEGPQRDEITRAVNGNTSIVLKGYLSRNEVFQELAKADVLIMPSLWEGLSILMLESMSLDKPMILSDIPSFREVTGEKELSIDESFRKCTWGYLVKTLDSNSYKAALLDLISCKKEMGKMQESVREISYKTDISFTASRYLEIYKEICC